MILAIAALLPFLTKAHTVDDAVFLRQAEHVLRDPLHPTAFEMVSGEDQRRRLSAWQTSGPGMAYVLVPAALVGGSEWLAHLTQLIFLCLGIVATISVALRLGLRPADAGIAGLLLAAAPAVLAMSGTSMPDIPAMALGALAIDRLLAWKESQRWSAAAAAALLLALAAAMRMHLLVLMVVGSIPILCDTRLGRALPWRDWLRMLAPLLAAPLLLFLLLSITRDPQPESGNVISGIRSFVAWNTIPRNLLSFLSHWVLVFPLVLPWVVLRRRAIRWGIAGALLLIGAGVLIPMLSLHWWRLPILAVSAAVLIDILEDGWKRRDWTQLFLTAWLFLAAPAFIYPHVPPKYLLASAPAVALLVARLASTQSPWMKTSVIGGAIIAGVTLGVLILQADSRLAETGRRAAREVIAPLVAASERVWSVGHWGFQWYAEKAGARTLSQTPPFPSPGDVVVVSTIDESRAIDLVPKRRLIRVMSDRTPGGRVMSRPDDAGFYSSQWGSLPWAWGHGEVNRVEVWRVE